MTNMRLCPLVFRYAPSSLNLFYAFDGNKNVWVVDICSS